MCLDRSLGHSLLSKWAYQEPLQERADIFRGLHS